jgi:type I restriction enzyme S subunit
MSESKLRTLIPELRFPEFQETEGWEEKSLGMLGKTISGLSGKSGVDFGEGKSFITYKQVFDSTRVDLSKCGRVKIYEGEKQNILQFGDILFTTSSETPDEVGYASLILDNPVDDLYLNSFCFSLRPHDLEELTPEFSRYLFHSPMYRQLVTSIAQGSTRFNLSKSSFLRLKLPIPSLKEQQKIAGCLSSIDKEIFEQEEKLIVIQAYKKGLMQQLFPAKGEAVPKLRFPEFQGQKEWNRGKVDDLTTLIMGNAFKSSDYVEEGVQLIRMGNLYQGKLQLARLPVRLPHSFEQDYFKFVIKPLDLLMSMTGTVGKEDYGFVVQVPIDSPKFMLNQRVVKLSPKRVCVKEFLLQLLKTDCFLMSLYSLPGGTKQANLSGTQLKGIEIKFPELEEQQKIADSLSSIDVLIAAVNKKIDSLKIHKKGLMQQLFPKLGTE